MIKIKNQMTNSVGHIMIFLSIKNFNNIKKEGNTSLSSLQIILTSSLFTSSSKFKKEFLNTYSGLTLISNLTFYYAFRCSSFRKLLMNLSIRQFLTNSFIISCKHLEYNLCPYEDTSKVLWFLE